VIAPPRAGVLEEYGLRRSLEVHAWRIHVPRDPPRTLEVYGALLVLEVDVGVLRFGRGDLVFGNQITAKLECFCGLRAVDGNRLQIVANELGVVLPQPAVPHAE